MKEDIGGFESRNMVWWGGISWIKWIQMVNFWFEAETMLYDWTDYRDDCANGKFVKQVGWYIYRYLTVIIHQRDFDFEM